MYFICTLRDDCLVQPCVASLKAFNDYSETSSVD